MANLIIVILYFSATCFLASKAYPHKNPLHDLKMFIEGGGNVDETTVKSENLEIGSLKPNATCAPTTTPSSEPSPLTEEYTLTHYRDSRKAPAAMPEPEPLPKNTHWDGPGNNIRNLPRLPFKALQAISPDPSNHNVHSNFSCNGPRGSLVQISESSKFFADKVNTYTYDDAKMLCKMLQLTIADLDDVPDQHSLANFFEKAYKKHFAPSEEKYFIGMNDITNEGLFQKGDGTNITYQSFHTSQPDDKNQTEDCTVVGKQTIGGPLGISDEDCNKTFKVLCMHPKNSECYNNTKEAEENDQFRSTHGIKLVTNITRRVYYASTYQVTWVQAIEACASEKMKLFDMDSLASDTFFRGLSKWEDETFNASWSPPIQYWTSGRFENTHMKAELYWHNETKHNDSDVKGSNKMFTFSGIFQWSTKKLVDPGGPYNQRRDLCLSFGLESKDDLKPFIRNSNCEIPQYFICVQDFNVKNQNTDYNYDDGDDKRKRNAESDPKS